MQLHPPAHPLPNLQPLTTARWEEVLPSLRNMVAAAALVRAELAAGQQGREPSTPSAAAQADNAPTAPISDRRTSCACCREL